MNYCSVDIMASEREQKQLEAGADAVGSRLVDLRKQNGFFLQQDFFSAVIKSTKQAHMLNITNVMNKNPLTSLNKPGKLCSGSVSF